jgi:hypothetical protein
VLDAPGVDINNCHQFNLGYLGENAHMVTAHLTDANHARPDGTVSLAHELHSAPLFVSRRGEFQLPSCFND